MLINENNFAFIDGANTHIGVENQGWKIDYSKFRVYLEEKYGVSKAFIFIGHISTHASLYKKLQQDGFILIFKPTLKDAKGNVKGNCDADLVLNVMIELDNFKKAVIVSGDGDFYSLVEYLYENDKLKKLLPMPRVQARSVAKGETRFLSALHQETATC